MLTMRIYTNTTSMFAQGNLKKSQDSLGKSIERLASGLRINGAKDDAAGQAIANRMDSRIRGISQAQRNTSDAISLIQTAEGALSEINELMHRMRELSVQEKNDTLSLADRNSIRLEIEHMKLEINRIGATTSFNGTSLFSAGGSLDIQIGAGTNDESTLPINLKQIDTDILGLETSPPPVGPPIKSIFLTSGPHRGKEWQLELEGIAIPGQGMVGPEAAAAYYGLSGPEEVTAHRLLQADGTYHPTIIAIKVGSTYYARAMNDNSAKFDDVTGIAQYRVNNTVNGNFFDPDNGGAIPNVQIHNSAYGYDTDGNLVQYIKYQDKTYRYTGGEANMYLSGPNANEVQLKEADLLPQIDKAMLEVDRYRSYLGATQNRLESIINGQQDELINLKAAQSRIQDADYAVEISNMTRSQILQQAGQAVLAQANQIPQGILSLLR